MTDEYVVDESLKSQLDAEALLLMQINRMAVYRDTEPKKYCSSIETLILICPRYIRDKSMGKIQELGLRRGHYEAVNEERLVLYDDLLVFLMETLERQKMVWKKRSVRTFE